MIKKNIEITINSKTRQVNFEDNFLGINGENLQGYLIFKFEDNFVNGVPVLKVEQDDKTYNIYEVVKEDETYKVLIKSSLLKNDVIYMALSITENGTEEEIPVFITKKFYMYVGETIESNEEIPNEYSAWIDVANQKMAEMDNLNIDMQDGIVTITRKDGTQYSENVKGDKGEKGDAGSIKFIIVNELPTENIDESAMYLKPNENPEEQNTYNEYVYANGQWELLGNAKVEVDLTGYVKNTDKATNSEAGIISFYSNYGVTYDTVNGNSVPKVVKATENDINARTNSYKPIVPSNLDYAVKSVVGGHITLTQDDYNTLVSTGTVTTEDGITYTFDENTYYYIEEE